MYAGGDPCNNTDPSGALFSPGVACALSFVGIGVAAIGLFAGGGALIVGAAFLGLGLSGLFAFDACYDDEGNPI